MGQIISIINQKGGVGKTTCALAIGGGLAQLERRILFVDLDPQGNLSQTLGADGDWPSVFEVLTRSTSPREAVQTIEAGGLIAASPALAGADAIINATGKEYRLREALSSLAAEYDVVIIDTPPALGILTINALTASAGIVIPAQADIYSLQGVGQLHQTIEAVRQYCNPGLEILGIVLTRHNSRSVLSRDLAEIMAQTAEQLKTRLFKTTIREAVVIREAQAKNRSLYAYAPKSGAASDYLALVEELRQRT
jgi:chromosome partitioning protein